MKKLATLPIYARKSPFEKAFDYACRIALQKKLLLTGILLTNVLIASFSQKSSVLLSSYDSCHVRPPQQTAFALKAGRTASLGPILRVAYVIPSNRTAQPDGVTNLQHAIKEGQQFFKDQMEQNGFGAKTFVFEKGADGVTPLIHVVNVAETDEYLRGNDANDLWGRTIQAAINAGISLWAEGEVWVVIPEAHLMLPDGKVTGGVALGASNGTGNSPGVSMIGSNALPLFRPGMITDDTPYDGKVIPELGPYPMKQDVTFAWFEGTTFSTVASSWLGALWHETGHAFGLPHDFRNDNNFHGNLMGNGLRGTRGSLFPEKYPQHYTRLEYASALVLNVSHYFNGDKMVTSGPALSHANPGSVIPQQGHVHVSFQASDPDGLSFANLRYRGDMVAEIVLQGTEANTFFAVPYFTQGDINQYTIAVYDIQGNATYTDVQFNVPAGNNQAPVPFIMINPPVPGLNQPVALSATQSYDADHDLSSIVATWDVDNDGQFDTAPSTNKTIQYLYENPGNYLIRVKVTDPAGAQTISTAVSVKIPGEKKVTVESFTLVDADKDLAVAELQDGLVIKQAAWEGKTFSVRANTSPGMIDRIEFNLMGPIIHEQIDTEPPYALFGDSPAGNFIGRELLPGEYALMATPFLGSEKGIALTISFTVEESTPGQLIDRTIGGSGNDDLGIGFSTLDGGYFLAGHSNSNTSGDKSEDSRGASDSWIVKVDAQYNKLWDKTFGGENDESFTSVAPTLDGGFLFGGYSNSDISGDKTGPNKGLADYWVVKVDMQGNKVWDKTFGGNANDVLSDIVLSRFGGYLLAGYSESDASGDKSENSKGGRDFWVVRIDFQGNKMWDKTIGGSGTDEVQHLFTTIGDGWLVYGNSDSDKSGDKSENNKGSSDYWVIEIDSEGNKIWDKTIGGSDSDILSAAQLTPDGSCLLVGSSISGASGDKSENSKGAWDYWVVKIDAVGNKVWDKTFGGNEIESATSVAYKQDDASYLLGGVSNSNASGDKSENSKGDWDYWVVKIDADGNKVWDKDIGGSDADNLTSTILTPNGNYLLTGSSSSNVSVDKSENSKGLSDFWIVELQEPTQVCLANLVGEPDATSVKLHWNPYSGSETIIEYRVKRNGIVVGSTIGKYGYYTDFGLTPGTEYFYTVEIVGSNGIICQSNEIPVTTTNQTTIKTHYKLLAIAFNPTGELGQSELDHIKTFLNYRLDVLKNASHNSVNLDLYTNDVVIFNSPLPLDANSNVDYAQLASSSYSELGGNSMIDLIERYDIDLVWAVGLPPGDNFAENVLMGSKNLGNNTWPAVIVKCSRLFFMNSNSPDARAFDAAAHHVEGTMTSATEGSPENWPRDKEFLVYKANRSDVSVYPTMLHLWGRFRLTDEWNGAYATEGHMSSAYASKGNASCGSSHFVPGSIRSSTTYDDYTYYDIEAWQRYVDGYADEWLNYPNFSGKSRKINGYDFSAFNNYQENGSTSPFTFASASFHYWWFNHIPHNSGVSDGKLNNWWPYIYDFNRFDGSAIQYPVDGFPVVPATYSTTNDEYGTEEGGMDTNWMFWHSDTDFGQRADVSTVSKSQNSSYVKTGQGSIKVDVDVEAFSFNGRNDAIYPRYKNAHWDFSSVDSITFSIKFTDQQLITGTNPIIRLCKNGNNRIEFVPKKNGLYTNLFKDIGFVSSDGWYTFRIPVSGNATWARNLIGYIDPDLSQSDQELAKQKVIESILADVNYFEISIQSDGGRGQSLVYYIDNLKVHTKDTTQHPLSIVSFSLINEKTGAVIREFKDSLILDLANLSLKHLAIQAHTFPEQVGSVEFSLDNKTKHTENVFPYIFTLPHHLEMGTHTVKADVYSEAHRKGEQGMSLTATVIVTNSIAVVSFDLVTTSGKFLRRLNEGDILYLDDLKANGQTIVANTTGQPGSVKFSLNNSFYNLENVFPYTFTGNSETYFNPWIPQAGTYTIAATPYSKSNAGGSAGQSLTLHLTVKPQILPAVVSYDLVNTSGKVLRRLNEGDILYLDDLKAHGQTIVANTTGQPGSVKFSLNNSFYNLENVFPYTFTGNSETYFNPWIPQAGTYAIAATPYSKSNAGGSAGQSLTIHLTVKPQILPAVVSYDIVNTSGKVLRRLKEGDILYLDDLKHNGQTIVANTTGQVGSVKFFLNNSFYNLENVFPYTFTGNSETYFNPWKPNAGLYTLTATPYSKSNATGSTGNLLTIHLTVTDKNNSAARMITTGSEEDSLVVEDVSELTIYPVPVENELFVRMDDTVGKDAILSIQNLQGVIVYQGTYSQSSSISTVDFRSGVYVLQVVSSNGYQRRVKFIKK